MKLEPDRCLNQSRTNLKMGIKKTGDSDEAS